MSVNFVLSSFDVSSTLWLIVNLLQGYDVASPGNGVPDLGMSRQMKIRTTRCFER